MKSSGAAACLVLFGWCLITAAFLALQGCATATTLGADDQTAVKGETTVTIEPTQGDDRESQLSPSERALLLREQEYRRAMGQARESATLAGRSAMEPSPIEQARRMMEEEYELAIRKAREGATEPSPQEQALRLREEEYRRATARTADAERFERAAPVTKATKAPSFEPTSPPKEEEFERKEEYEAFVTALESQVQMAKLSPPQRTETSSKSRSYSKSRSGGDFEARMILLMIILAIDPALWPIVLAPGG